MRCLRARAEYLLKTEGLRGLLGGARRRLRAVRRSWFTREDYIVYRFETEVASLPSRRPEVAGLDVVVLESLEDVQRLVEQGYDVPLFHSAVQVRWLRRGGVAFCAFVDRRLAHIAWVALREDARGCCDGLPYVVDFAHGEAATGGAWTVPAYRGRGLYRYMFGRELDYLRRNGRTICCNAIGTNNEASQRGQAVYGAETYARARLVRVLAFSRWTEHPVAATFAESVPGSPQTQRTDAASVSGQ